MKNILLATLKTLPKLIEGKVCVINDDNTYSLYNAAKGCIINDNYNPLEYSILIDKKYSKCIIYSKKEERANFLVNKQIQELKIIPIVYRVGDKIHIHSRRGIYELVKIFDNILVITCKKWQYEDNKIHYILKSDFKCLAGGRHNQVYE